MITTQIQNSEFLRKKTLLLLSGGKDSRASIVVLRDDGWDVIGLCIDGIQGKEKVGAIKSAYDFKIPIVIQPIFFFDEETWNPLKLIIRDIAMGFFAIYYAKKFKASAIAVGVKLNDTQNPNLKWLSFFLKISKMVISIFGLELIFPVWNRKS